MADIVQTVRVSLVLAILCAVFQLHAARATDAVEQDREKAVSYHCDALEAAARGKFDTNGLERFVDEFERGHCAETFIAETTRDERLARLKQILGILGSADSGETVISPNEIRLQLFSGDSIHEVIIITQDEAPFAITSLNATDVTDSRPNYSLTVANVADAFGDLEKSGFSGVAYVKKNGSVLIEAAYGTANEVFGYPITLDTVFGIGSTPMDFTLVAILLLEQRGQLSQDDTLERYFENIPTDKKSISIRHLLTGRSGLPNFFNTKEDWDPDLAYVNRRTAEERLLSQELLFEPGKGTNHSHGAYGLLSSIIERVSGQDYFTFLKDNFFDPAGMTRTAMYGETMGLPMSEFAVGQGPEFVGLPNIPPNWGKTSWLVLGSGGMCSTLKDMLKFYALVRTDKVLTPPYNKHFNRFGASLNGSMRGAYLAHAYTGADNEAILMSNIDADSPREGDVDEKMTAMVRALEKFVVD